MLPMKVGVLGCGNICGIYLETMSSMQPTEVVAVSDLDMERARAAADKYGIAHALTPMELLNSDAELIVNLTVPKVHAQLNDEILSGGRHVYVEKPLATSVAAGTQTMALSKQHGVRVGCAPDTFLGGGLQTCREIIDSGEIGDVIGAHCFMMGHGPEGWHPSPEFFYEVGGGPLFDMGPYYLTALVNLIGPIKKVSGMARASFPTRTITSEPKNGKVVDVETPTHIVGVLDFMNGAIAQVTMSFDVWHHRLPNIEIYGSEGSMVVPDPNGFGGPILVRGKSDADWREVEITRPYSQNSRGLGVLDMVCGIRGNRPHRASGELAFHVLETMSAILDASDQGKTVDLQPGFARPVALPGNITPGEWIE